MEKQFKTATKRLLDSVWTLEFYELPDHRIEIISHSRENQKGYDLEGSVSQFKLIEDNNRTVIGVQFAKPDPFKFEPGPAPITYIVTNPNNIFGYPDPKPEHRSPYQIACEIGRIWKKVHPAAKPYLSAMKLLSSIDQMYGEDSASMIVSYFLSNATTWRGEDARRIKTELKELLNSKK